MAFDIDEMRRKVEAGSVVSQGFLGAFYLFGEQGVPVDYAEAFKWLSLAAAEGAWRPIAQVGYMYEHGLGVEKDMAEAVRLYKDSARRGNSDAALQLAEMYSQGQGVPIDSDEAIRWYAVYEEDNESPADVITEAMEYLSSIPDSITKLTTVLESDPLFLARAGAAKLLGKIQAVSAIPALMKAVEDKAPVVQSWAILALGAFKEWDEAGVPDKETVTQFLLRLSHDDRESTREAALYSITCGVHNTKETYERLWEALDDPSPDVRGQGVFGLSLYEDPECTERLDDLLRHDADIPELYFDAAAALGDPSLLPAVLIAAERWRKSPRRDTLRYPVEFSVEYPGIQSAIQHLIAASEGDAEAKTE